MKTKFKKNNAVIVMLAIAFILNSVQLVAQEHPDSGTTLDKHIMISPGEVQWLDGPPSLPPGAKFAVIEGDAKKEGLFTMRIKMPAGYVVPAHWHPVDEHVTVISGTFKMGMGDKFDRKDLMPMPPGTFAVMPVKTIHFAAADEECIIQVHAMGPWAITYVNPADDPRKK